MKELFPAAADLGNYEGKREFPKEWKLKVVKY